MTERIAIGYKQARIREINAELNSLRVQHEAIHAKERNLKRERDNLLDGIQADTLADLSHPGYTRLLNEVAL